MILVDPLDAPAEPGYVTLAFEAGTPVALDGRRLGPVEMVETLNRVRTMLHEAGPFREEPVDLVLWKLGEHVVANDYNPNAVAPPELELDTAGNSGSGSGLSSRSRPIVRPPAGRGRVRSAGRRRRTRATR